LAHGAGAARRGRKLVVQMAQTFRTAGVPTFVETLDAVDVGRQAGMPLPPVMIYGDDVSHVVTEEGVAYLFKAHSLADRRAALAAIAGVTPVGRTADARRTEELRRDGLVAFPEDLGVETRLANRSLLAARSIDDLVAWSGGLYDPPAQFRDW
jgi:malonate decarboxylase alpha subunit